VGYRTTRGQLRKTAALGGEARVARDKYQFWGGFMGGKLHIVPVDTGFGGFGDLSRMPAIFSTRARARLEYQDVRPVEVRELRQAKRSKP